MENELFARFVLLSGSKIYFFLQNYTSQTKYFFGSLINWSPCFFKNENYHLFSYSYVSKVPKWKCAHNLLCKKYKNCLKLIKIADLQPPDWIQRKKNTLYILYTTIIIYIWEIALLIILENIYHIGLISMLLIALSDAFTRNDACYREEMCALCR